MEKSSQAEPITRRSFLGYGVAAVGAFVAGVLGTSTAIFAASPVFAQKRGTDVSLGLASAFQVGVPKSVEFPVQRSDGWVSEETKKSVWVVRTGESSFVTYNPRCTHLGCAYSWDQQSKTFKCPCHGGTFSLQGDVLAGPPPRPLDRLDNHIDGENLMVSYRDFRLGVPEKVEA